VSCHACVGVSVCCPAFTFEFQELHEPCADGLMWRRGLPNNDVTSHVCPPSAKPDHPDAGRVVIYIYIYILEIMSYHR
jgi:hypothetical protein